MGTGISRCSSALSENNAFGFTVALTLEAHADINSIARTKADSL
jgi:hypothetical protein